jgi:hypothetical protein
MAMVGVWASTSLDSFGSHILYVKDTNTEHVHQYICR